jgi:hypothetical protein
MFLAISSGVMARYVPATWMIGILFSEGTGYLANNRLNCFVNRRG